MYEVREAPSKSIFYLGGEVHYSYSWQIHPLKQVTMIQTKGIF